MGRLATPPREASLWMCAHNHEQIFNQVNIYDTSLSDFHTYTL
ncbi:MAG: hypothetical protein BJ554DRAFT_2212 [Olpidium bornovanus]|uniref:Uncharacterized protein n=1 Tax=Olpidium bornovanus TaxID=278681 RepID=A0A8H7ZQI4_9FUNG|nr:MAG: hypothetical protein BJ554DRAFT_2212 [Olpidium bornovanus]